MKHAVVTKQLTKQYGRVHAIDRLNLELPKGEIIALLGPNGAGKSTLLKILVNLIRPDQGTASILDTPTTRLKSYHFTNIGFVAEDLSMPKNLTVNQYLSSYRPFYDSWDKSLETTLLNDLDLDASIKIKNLSRGQRMKAQLVGALSYRPEMVILDEPLGGLDPLMRRELLGGILEVAAGDEPPTVVISSHDVDEIEHVASWLTFISRGQKMLSTGMSEIERSYRHITLRGATATSELPDSVLAVQHTEQTTSCIDPVYDPETWSNCHNVEIQQVSLKQLFHILARSERKTVSK